MARLIFNTLMIAAILILVSVAIVGIIKLLNLLVQWAAGQLGYEVGDFLSWVRTKLPHRKCEPENITYLILDENKHAIGFTDSESDAQTLVRAHRGYSYKPIETSK